MYATAAPGPQSLQSVRNGFIIHGSVCVGPQGPPAPVAPFVVDEEELKAAFSFFDVRSAGKVTASDLKVSRARP